MKKIIIEVGTNYGQDINHLIKSYPDSIYYGFEPNINLYNKLISSANEKINFLPFAVSDYNGFANFYIMKDHYETCSSLNEFEENIDENYFEIISSFQMNDKHRVPVIRLDSFLDCYVDSPCSIEYIWIDAQGEDVKALMSLGKYLQFVKAGRIEVVCENKFLYKNTKSNSYENALSFFESNNFKYRIIEKQAKGAEANLEFYK
jgi:FkbM family methyltransferase